MSPTDRASLYSRLSSGLAELGLAPDVQARERLLDYIELLTRWNTAYNLTAVRGPADMVTRHLLDSLAVARLVRGETLADLGTGAGLPGIPLAILAPQRQHTLIDSNGKKVRFLREAVRTLGLGHVRIEQARVEDARGAYDCITARAFASLGDMLRMGGHLLAPHGVWLALKGQLAREEMLDLPAGFVIDDVQTLDIPGLGAARQVAIISRVNTQEQAA